MMRVTFIFCLVISFLSIKAQQPPQSSQETHSDAFLPHYLYSRVKQIRFNNSTASCFFHSDSNIAYIVTVRHLFTKTIIKKEGKTYRKSDSLLCHNGETVTFEIWDENKWNPYKATIFLDDLKNKQADICVLKMKEQSQPSTISLLEYDTYLLGQRVFFCGYPLGLKSPGESEFGYSLPLIKSGIFSGTEKKTSDGNSIIYLDGNNTYGLSGAPVFFYDYIIKNWRIAGMIIGYLKQTDMIFNNTTGKYEYKEENSGIIVSIGSDQILELINRIRK